MPMEHRILHREFLLLIGISNGGRPGLSPSFTSPLSSLLGTPQLLTHECTAPEGDATMYGNGRIRTFGGYQPRWFSRPVHSSALPRFQMPSALYLSYRERIPDGELPPRDLSASTPRRTRTDTEQLLRPLPLPIGLEGQVGGRGRPPCIRRN